MKVRKAMKPQRERKTVKAGAFRMVQLTALRISELQAESGGVKRESQDFGGLRVQGDHSS